MSFRRGAFGTGFSITAQPTSVQRRFEELTLREGKTVTLIHLTKTGHDAYGEPEYTEAETTAKALINYRGSETITIGGDLPRCDLSVYFKAWENVDETGLYIIEVDELRYNIKAVITTDAYRVALCDRRIDN